MSESRADSCIGGPDVTNEFGLGYFLRFGGDGSDDAALGGGGGGGRRRTVARPAVGEARPAGAPALVQPVAQHVQQPDENLPLIPLEIK